MEVIKKSRNLKASFKCEENYKTEFANSHCVLTISMGQEAHEGDKFLAIIKLVNKHFQRCTILLGDTLQRHFQAIFCDSSDDELYTHYLSLGNLWLERNQPIYSLITKPLNIVRWDQWLHHSKYSEVHATINERYHTDLKFKTAIDESAFTFVERLKKRIPYLDCTRALTKSLDYLKEECTAFCLWIEGGYHFDIYPGKRNSAFIATHKYFINQKIHIY